MLICMHTPLNQFKQQRVSHLIFVKNNYRKIFKIANISTDVINYDSGCTTVPSITQHFPHKNICQWAMAFILFRALAIADAI